MHEGNRKPPFELHSNNYYSQDPLVNAKIGWQNIRRNRFLHSSSQIIFLKIWYLQRENSNFTVKKTADTTLS